LGLINANIKKINAKTPKTITESCNEIKLITDITVGMLYLKKNVIKINKRINDIIDINPKISVFFPFDLSK
jgi:hypothetical protein